MKPRSLVAGYFHPDFLTNSDTPQPRPAWNVPDLHDPCRRPVSGVDQSHGDTGRRIAPPRLPGGPAAALCRIPHNAYRLVVLVHAEPVVLAVVQDCQVSLRRSEPEPPFTPTARRLNRNRQPKRIDDPPTRRPVSSPPDRGTASGWCPHGLLTPQLGAPQTVGPPAHHRVPNNGAFPAQSSDTSHTSKATAYGAGSPSRCPAPSGPFVRRPRPDSAPSDAPGATVGGAGRPVLSNTAGLGATTVSPPDIDDHARGLVEGQGHQ